MSSNEPRQIIVLEDDDGQRLDRWAKKHVPDLSYVLVQKLARKGQIRVDGKRVKTDVRLATGQEVRLPPLRDASQDKKPKGLSEKDVDFIQSLVIYEDEHVIAINKPSGLATQGGSKTHYHVDMLLDGLIGHDGVRPRLVHRLDKGTSGVLLLAKSVKVARVLGDAFKRKAMKKIYWALCSPVPEVRQGSVRAPIGKSVVGHREKMVVDEDGKYALTDYCVLDNALDRVAFIAFYPRTGRTHQIRVHTQLLGAAIIGDDKYETIPDPDSQKPLPDLSELDIADRLHLHARRIVCPHPAQAGWLDITAPLPPELMKSWKSLSFDYNDKTDPFEDLEFKR